MVTLAKRILMIIFCATHAPLCLRSTFSSARFYVKFLYSKDWSLSNARNPTLVGSLYLLAMELSHIVVNVLQTVLHLNSSMIVQQSPRQQSKVRLRQSAHHVQVPVQGLRRTLSSWIVMQRCTRSLAAQPNPRSMPAHSCAMELNLNS